MPPLGFTAANSTVSVVAGDLIKSAMFELAAFAPGEALSAEDSDWGLECLQRRTDLINAQRQLVYSVNFSLFTLVPNTQPITIGPGGQFNQAFVPVRIPSWALVLSGSGGIDIPGQMLDDSEWAAITIKRLTSTLCTALYYDRQPALGNLNFWPIPTVANQVRLQLWGSLPQALILTTALAIPPGYWMYLVCAVASDMACAYGQSAMQVVASPSFRQKYGEALNAIKANNAGAQNLVSDVPSGKKGSAIPDFNFLTGMRR